MSANIILLNRGDTLNLTLTLEPLLANAEYELDSDDVIYFGVTAPKQKFEDALIRLRYTADDWTDGKYLTIKILPIDTLYLDPGVYYYSIKLKKGSGDVVTLLNKTKLVIQE